MYIYIDLVYITVSYYVLSSMVTAGNGTVSDAIVLDVKYSHTCILYYISCVGYSKCGAYRYVLTPSPPGNSYVFGVQMMF